MAKAIPFIVFRQESGFYLNPEAAEFLTALPKDKELVVISIVGKYRTGKSYIANKVLLGLPASDPGFSVGPTINPCTKGLWIWTGDVNKRFKAGPNQHVLVVDSEGIAGIHESINHDSRIFLFSLLLSSTFIYNSVGSIDENALNNLELIINLAKMITEKQQNESDQSVEIKDNSLESEACNITFPYFIWLLRDFALQIRDQAGNALTDRDYLAMALELKKGDSDVVKQKNKLRRLIKQVFPNRDCVCLVRPMEDETDLQNLNYKSNGQIRPEFAASCEELLRRVRQNINPNKIQGLSLNGVRFVELCQSYIKAVNDQAIPQVNDTWQYIIQNEAYRAIKLVSEFLEKMIDQMDRPLSDEELKELELRLKTEMTAMFQNQVPGGEIGQEEFYKILNDQYRDQMGFLEDKNKAMWAKRFEDLEADSYSLIQRKLQCQEYGDYSEFEADYLRWKDEVEPFYAASEQGHKRFLELSTELHRTAGSQVSQNIKQDQRRQSNLLRTQLENRHSIEIVNWEREKKELHDQLEEMRLQLEKERADGQQKWLTEEQKLSAEIQALRRELSTLKEKDQRSEKMREQLNKELQKLLKQKQETEERDTAYELQLSQLKTKIQILEMSTYDASKAAALQSFDGQNDSPEKQPIVVGHSLTTNTGMNSKIWPLLSDQQNGMYRQESPALDSNVSETLSAQNDMKPSSYDLPSSAGVNEGSVASPAKDDGESFSDRKNKSQTPISSIRQKNEMIYAVSMTPNSANAEGLFAASPTFCPNINIMTQSVQTENGRHWLTVDSSDGVADKYRPLPLSQGNMPGRQWPVDRFSLYIQVHSAPPLLSMLNRNSSEQQFDAQTDFIQIQRNQSEPQQTSNIDRQGSQIQEHFSLQNSRSTVPERSNPYRQQQPWQSQLLQEGNRLGSQAQQSTISGELTESYVIDLAYFGFEWQCKRYYEEFLVLQQDLLQKEPPDSQAKYISLPLMKSDGYLEEFLRDIQQSDYLTNSKSFLDFICFHRAKPGPLQPKAKHISKPKQTAKKADNIVKSKPPLSIPQQSKLRIPKIVLKK